jgi:hypothetical protein
MSVRHIRKSAYKAASQARKAGEKPRVHPNGFIQLDLVLDGSRIAQTRLHVWPDRDDIPTQSVATTIHDHRFDLRSTVLTGTLLQRRYDVSLTETPTHEIYIAQYPEDRKESVLGPSGVRVAVEDPGKRAGVLYGIEVFTEGFSYTQPMYTFHDTQWSGLTATLMEKVAEDKAHEPRVLVPLGHEPDNTFVRAVVDEELLWDYIERALT